MDTEGVSPFARLPADLLPAIISHLVYRNADLARCCLVSRQLKALAQPLLYSWIRAYGKDLAKLPAMFDVLQSNADLCALVQRLEIRVFPLQYMLSERKATELQASQIIRQAVNVTDLVWTRQGSLTDMVLEAIVSLPNLRSLEFNARTALSPGSWDATLLLRLHRLRTLSLIMPDRNVANLLPVLLAKQRSEPGVPGLEHFTLLCRESNVITSKLFDQLVPALTDNGAFPAQLRSLALAGCPKLTSEPLIKLLRALEPNMLEHLAVEATAINADFYTAAAGHLGGLRSLKLTHPGPTSLDFWDDLLPLVQSTKRLEALTVYSAGQHLIDGKQMWAALEPSFVDGLLESGIRLRKFEVSNVIIGPVGLERVSRMDGLLHLVIHVGYQINLDVLKKALRRLPQLRTLHVLSQRADVLPPEVLSIAIACSRSLRQIGWRNRVWTLSREIVADAVSADPPFVPQQLEDDELPSPTEEPQEKVKTTLVQWDSPFWPEALLVIHQVGDLDEEHNRVVFYTPTQVVRVRESSEAFGAFRRNRYGAEDDMDDPDDD